MASLTVTVKSEKGRDVTIHLTKGAYYIKMRPNMDYPQYLGGDTNSKSNNIDECYTVAKIDGYLFDYNKRHFGVTNLEVSFKDGIHFEAQKTWTVTDLQSGKRFTPFEDNRKNAIASAVLTYSKLMNAIEKAKEAKQPHIFLTKADKALGDKMYFDMHHPELAEKTTKEPVKEVKAETKTTAAKKEKNQKEKKANAKSKKSTKTTKATKKSTKTTAKESTKATKGAEEVEETVKALATEQSTDKKTKLNDTRQMLVDKYLEALEKNQIPWEQGWIAYGYKNGISNMKYKGVNALLLNAISLERGYSGRRWYTFKQIADRQENYHKGEKWHLKKGSKSVPVEYWYMFNTEEKKYYTFTEYNQHIVENPDSKDDFFMKSRTYWVFNEDDIEGITPEVIEDTAESDINSSELINNAIANMGVKYEEKGDKAYYSPSYDRVVVPTKEQFIDDRFFYATQLHELCHATGHQSRLNRDMIGVKGTPSYAKEELRAEISASFLMYDLDAEYDESHTQNHIAYVQSWIQILKNDPKELFRAIKDAEEICKYMQTMMGIVTEDDAVTIPVTVEEVA